MSCENEVTYLVDATKFFFSPGRASLTLTSFALFGTLQQLAERGKRRSLVRFRWWTEVRRLNARKHCNPSQGHYVQAVKKEISHLFYSISPEILIKLSRSGYHNTTMPQSMPELGMLGQSLVLRVGRRNDHEVSTLGLSESASK